MSLAPYLNDIRQLVEVYKYTYEEVGKHVREILGAPQYGTSVRNIRAFCQANGIIRTCHRIPQAERVAAVASAVGDVSL